MSPHGHAGKKRRLHCNPEAAARDSSMRAAQSGGDWSEREVGLTDAELVERTRAGDREAYGDLVTRYQGHVYGLAYSLAGRWEDAQDIAQETFIRAYCNLDQLREPARFPAWLRRVTVGVAVGWLRSFRPKLFARIDGQVDLETLEIPDFEPGPPEVLERKELAEAVQRAVASLPAKYRVPLTMFHLDGLSYEKVASFLDIPLGTAKSLLHRARAKLRDALGPYYTEEVLPMVAEVFNEHKLTPEFARRVTESIRGVRRLERHEWRDCSYGGAVAALMHTIGIPVTYEEVMGLSGACYRICVTEGWDPSGGMPQVGYDVEKPLYRALGFDVYRIGDADERRRKVIECIDRGIPVLCGEQRGFPEWGLITGYAAGGKIFFGRTYDDAKGAREDETFTEDRYFLADKYPGFDVQFFDRRCRAIPPNAALKQSLEVCIGTLNLGPTGASNEYVHGYQAYELWICGLEDEGRFKEFPVVNNGHQLNQLRDARRCAHIYLQRSLDVLANEGRARLERVVGLYRAMFDKLMTVAPYHVGGEAPLGAEVVVWDMRKRKAFANVLREVYGLERQAEAEFRAILAHWD
jgi:RNA polymerase sigma factor (sigma-70 family)